MVSAASESSSEFPLARRSRRRTSRPWALGALLASNLPAALAQSCISLADSAACPSFNASSISTSSALIGLFPFLSSVTSTANFDSGLDAYIANGFTQLRYEQLIGCSNVNLDNTTAFYARYTTSVLCNAIVQNSITTCALTGDAARPLCAESCASYAQSEEEITASNICGTAGTGALTQIRADFTNCALPGNALTGSCIAAVQNEPDNCGYSDNTGGLCSYCATSSPNATDSCCVFSNTTTRCVGVTLPIIAASALAAVTVTAPTTPSGSATGGAAGTAGAGAASTRHGLTGGEIAGIVVGTVLGALLLLALLIAGCLLLRRRRDSSPRTSVFDQPGTIQQHQPPMAYSDGARDLQSGQPEHDALGGFAAGRVTRMAALEGSSSGDDHGYRKSMSDEERISDARYHLGLAPPPKRSGSLSSGSQLGIMGADNLDTSPSSQNDYTSPESQGQSEQLQFFKDYYSQDEISTGDAVATLWTYEPRAGDEFHLERGDMIKVIGIWDDGWATGVRIRQRAEDWRAPNTLQRDSGMSHGNSPITPETSDGEGDVKAFPLVCVCLPQHWRKTIEGDSTEGSGPPDFS